MAQVTPVQVIAAGRLNNNNGTWSFDWIRGASGIVDGGVGIVTLTLDDPADATIPGTATLVSPVSSAAGYFGTATRPSDTTVTFYLWSATAAAADVGFEFVIFQGTTTNV